MLLGWSREAVEQRFLKHENTVEEGKLYLCVQCKEWFIKGNESMRCLVMHHGNCCHYTDFNLAEAKKYWFSAPV